MRTMWYYIYKILGWKNPGSTIPSEGKFTVGDDSGYGPVILDYIDGSRRHYFDGVLHRSFSLPAVIGINMEFWVNGVCTARNCETHCENMITQADTLGLDYSHYMETTVAVSIEFMRYLQRRQPTEERKSNINKRTLEYLDSSKAWWLRRVAPRECAVDQAGQHQWVRSLLD